MKVFLKVLIFRTGYQVGVNTVGQGLRNANQQLRAEPPNPQVNVSPWLNTIGPDLARRPLKLGEDCYAPSILNLIIYKIYFNFIYTFMEKVNPIINQINLLHPMLLLILWKH